MEQAQRIASISATILARNKACAIVLASSANGKSLDCCSAADATRGILYSSSGPVASNKLVVTI